MPPAPPHRPPFGEFPRAARPLRAAAVLLAVLGLPAAAAGQSTVYPGRGGNWSATGTWVGGAVPPSGPNTVLRFDLTPDLSTLTTTNDLGNFSLNGLQVFSTDA